MLIFSVGCPIDLTQSWLWCCEKLTHRILKLVQIVARIQGSMSQFAWGLLREFFIFIYERLYAKLAWLRVIYSRAVDCFGGLVISTFFISYFKVIYRINIDKANTV